MEFAETCIDCYEAIRIFLYLRMYLSAFIELLIFVSSEIQVSTGNLNVIFCLLSSANSGIF